MTINDFVIGISVIVAVTFQVVLVVNVASECGFTDGHYKGLQQLHDLLHISERFTILAFPCNQFGEQEPAVSKKKKHKKNIVISTCLIVTAAVPNMACFFFCSAMQMSQNLPKIAIK